MKGYAAHERETFDAVTQARAAAQQAAGPAAAAQADAEMAPALNRLIAVSEAYPQLRASENFLALQQELADIEDKLAAARRYYNQTVYRVPHGQAELPGRADREAVRLPGARVLRHRRARRPCRQLRTSMTLQEQIRANRWRTLWLLVLFALLVGRARRRSLALRLPARRC